MVKPICVPCGLFFRPERNGQPVEEGKPHNTGGQPTRWSGQNPGDERGSFDWTSYKLYVGDKWKCRGCGAEIIVGIISGPIAYHHEKEYVDVREQWGGDTIPFVHDC